MMNLSSNVKRGTLDSRLKLAAIWLAPFLFGPIYEVVRILLHHVFPHLVGAPTTREVYSVILIELVSSPLWVGVGYAFTWALGGLAVVYIIRALAENSALKRKFVISTKDGRDLNSYLEVEEKQTLTPRSAEVAITKKNFSLCLALTLSINLFYTLALQRYFSDIVSLPSGASSASLYRYLLSPKLIVSDFLLALLFSPLITIVIPLFLGNVSVRQIDASRFDIYWLSYVYSIVGGASLVLFLVTEFQSKAATSYFIIAIFLVYGILSWNTALGINLALPAAEKLLAGELLKLREEKTEELAVPEDLGSGSKAESRNAARNKNIIFGHIYAGPSKEEADQV